MTAGLLRFTPFSPMLRSATSSPYSRAPVAATRERKFDGLISPWASRTSTNRLPSWKESTELSRRWWEGIKGTGGGLSTVRTAAVRVFSGTLQAEFVLRMLRATDLGREVRLLAWAWFGAVVGRPGEKLRKRGTIGGGAAGSKSIS